MRMRRTMTSAVLGLALTGGVVVGTAAPAFANATCVNSFYKLHGSTVAEGRIAADVEAAILVHTGAPDVTTAFNETPKDLYALLVEQYITTALNGTPGSTLDPSTPLGMAFYGLSTYFQYPTSFTDSQVIKWGLTLLFYNNGFLGVLTCGKTDTPPPPPKPCDSHTRDYYLTGAYQHESWGQYNGQGGNGQSYGFGW